MKPSLADGVKYVFMFNHNIIIVFGMVISNEDDFLGWLNLSSRTWIETQDSIKSWGWSETWIQPRLLDCKDRRVVYVRWKGNQLQDSLLIHMCQDQKLD
jgi:hypothetical protein